MTFQAFELFQLFYKKVLMKSSDTPKKEGPTKTWNEDSLNSALDALRTGTISANKASKAFGIPSSTLYKIARREGIRLAAPFNAAPTTWSAEDLEKALEGKNRRNFTKQRFENIFFTAIRAGAASVQKASTEFGIPTGKLALTVVRVPVCKIFKFRNTLRSL